MGLTLLALVAAIGVLVGVLLVMAFRIDHLRDELRRIQHADPDPLDRREP